MSLLCRLGLHKWHVYQQPVYIVPMHELLAMPLHEAARRCTRPGCNAHQKRSEHCLGLNPPAYSYRWYKDVQAQSNRPV